MTEMRVSRSGVSRPPKRRKPDAKAALFIDARLRIRGFDVGAFRWRVQPIDAESPGWLNNACTTCSLRCPAYPLHENPTEDVVASAKLLCAVEALIAEQFGPEYLDAAFGDTSRDADSVSVDDTVAAAPAQAPLFEGGGS